MPEKHRAGLRSRRWKNPLKVLTVVAILLCSSLLSAEIKLESSAAIVRGGRGATRLKITNSGSAAEPLKLTLGIFLDETSHARIDDPKVSLLSEAGGDLPTTIGPSQSLEIVAAVSDFSGALSAEAPIFNNGQRIGTLSTVAVDTPLNVTLIGAGTADQPLDYTYNHSVVIPLKNGGKDYLALDWRFMIAGSEEGANEITIPPGGEARIVIRPSLKPYSAVEDYFRPRIRTGVLLLRPHTQSGVNSRLFDLHPLQISVRLNRVGTDTTEMLFALYVMFFLLVGGALSLLANSILPNLIRRLGYEKQLSTLADRTSSISYRVDSHVRVLLRLERKKIEVALKDAAWYSLSIAEKIDGMAVDIARLEKRLTIAEKIDDLRRDFEEIATYAPPSAVDLVDKILDSACDQLHSFTLPDEVLDATNMLLGKASAEMKALEDSGELAKRVAVNFKELKSRLAVFPKSFYQDLEAALPGIFVVFTEAFDDPANIVPASLFAIDHAVAAGQILLDYALARATIAEGSSTQCTDPGKQVRERLLARECRLLELLGTLSWKSLREARILLRQIRENVYEEDVIEELSKREADNKPAVRIVFDTQRARPYLPIYFSLAFDNPKFKNAAALECLSFRWSFPGNLFEEGAKVCHYFVGNEPDLTFIADSDTPEIPEHRKSAHSHDDHKEHLSWIARFQHWRERRKQSKRGYTTWISVMVQQPDNLSTCARIHEKIKLDPKKPPRRSRTLVELVRFVLAFGVALAGVEAGALDQLHKLDFLAGTIAVIALGFGADSIKNLLAQAPRKTTT